MAFFIVGTEMALTNGSLANAWAPFDESTRLNLTITELDKLYSRLDQVLTASALNHSTSRDEFTQRIEAARAEFRERIDLIRSDMDEHVTALRKDAADWKQESQAAMRRLTGVGLGLLGGIVTGLVLLVAQIATSK